MTAYQVIVGGFLVILGAMAAVDLVGRRRRRSPEPLASALTAALRTPMWRVVVLGWWVWIGYHFLAR
jgi:Family of unknown function (DUF6186)